MKRVVTLVLAIGAFLGFAKAAPAAPCYAPQAIQQDEPKSVEQQVNIDAAKVELVSKGLVDKNWVE